MEVNRIYNGDCLELIKELPDGCIDAVITDPPYSAQMQHNGTATEASDLNICKPFFRELLKEITRVLKPDGFLYWFTDWRGYGFFYSVIFEILPPVNMLVWDKISGPGNAYCHDHELIVFCAKGKYNIGGSSIIKEPAFCSGARAFDGEKVHPTQKPTGLLGRLIRDCTKEGDVVLDCFAGSCSTAVAAIYNKRNFICFELQEKYCEIGQNRVNKVKQSFDFDVKEISKHTLF
jgi:site-specific DNA-methyltransferase (adenine-specific)